MNQLGIIRVALGLTRFLATAFVFWFFLVTIPMPVIGAVERTADRLHLEPQTISGVLAILVALLIGVGAFSLLR